MRKSATRCAQAVSSDADTIPFSAGAAVRFAEIRCDATIAAPDAMQLACAADFAADIFITDDARLSRKLIAGVRTMVSALAAVLI